MWSELLAIANKNVAKLYHNFRNSISKDISEDTESIINTPDSILIEALETLKKVNLNYE